MPTETQQGPEECTCLAVRQAARHITRFYDQYLVPVGLRATQYAILAKLKVLGPMTINALADELVMDRTTLGRNILPLDPGLRQPEFLASAVSEPRHDAEETFAFERQDVPTKRRAIHHELIGQSIDRHRP
jgi:hypothetical protein